MQGLFIRKTLIKKWASKSTKPLENFKKSPASNATVAIFKNADISYSS